MANMDRVAIAYRNAHQFLRALKAHKDDVDWQQYKALREMALSGNVDGAFRALEDALAGR